MNPMKYSLRSLMIGITLACIGAGYAGHVIYCQREADFHKREADAIGEGLLKSSLSKYPYKDSDRFWHHCYLADQYREAKWKPWVAIRDDWPWEGDLQDSLEPAPNRANP